MASAIFSIKWETRPCLFHHGDFKTEKGFWHMWHVPESGINRGNVVGIVEDDAGSICCVKSGNIVFLDYEEKFKNYDWELMAARRAEAYKAKEG